MDTDPDPVVLYDGECGFCCAIVRFASAHDRRRTMRFAPLQDAERREIIARHRELAQVDSVYFVEHQGTASERVMVRSDAALAIARRLGGPWRLFAVLRIVPRAWRDAAYDFVARRRATCALPYR